MDSNWINWESSRTVFEGKIETFEKLLQKCNEEKITVIGVITPQNPAYKETGAFGRHGLLRSAVPKYMKILDDFMEKYGDYVKDCRIIRNTQISSWSMKIKWEITTIQTRWPWMQTIYPN